MPNNWIAIASAEHVRLGRKQGFMQVCHGKAGPLKRIAAGDGIAYYSPSETFRGNDKLQAFIAIGRVRGGEPYLFDTGGGFRPYRRDVDWLAASEAPIRPLLEALDFTAGHRNWGYKFRFGLFSVTEHDFDLIADAMGARLPEPA